VELRGLEPLASCMPWEITQVHCPKAAHNKTTRSGTLGNRITAETTAILQKIRHPEKPSNTLIT
jgi:hypothetical protein